MRYHGLARGQRRPQIRSEHPLPDVPVLLVHRLPALEGAGGCNQSVDPAELRDRLIERGAHSVSIR
jgi:hypothetical protein